MTTEKLYTPDNRRATILVKELDFELSRDNNQLAIRLNHSDGNFTIVVQHEKAAGGSVESHPLDDCNFWFTLEKCRYSRKKLQKYIDSIEEKIADIVELIKEDKSDYKISIMDLIIDLII